MDTNDAELNATLAAWLQRDPDDTCRAELEQLQADGAMDELQRRFRGRLAFGTAGLRGIVGAGPTRMNRLVVQETSAGFASYLLDQVANAAARGVVVTYDARPDSRQFAEDATGVFLGAGLRVYLTEAAQPTPVGAFAALYLDAAAAVVITASHNPPQYNGYKVYWQNGAQIIPPHDQGIAERIELAATETIPLADLAKAEDDKRLHWVGDELLTRYRERVLSYCQSLSANDRHPLKLAYTAMHGVGAKLALALLQAAGGVEVFSVASQHEPDGRFPTVSFPNPEEPGAMDAVIALAENHQAALACANDPDADRLAVAARVSDGRYQMLTGDQVGVLLADYALKQPQPFTPIVCASLVSSQMLSSIAAAAGAQFHETLTGFKWLSNIALQHEDAQHRFFFAYEEALGYALGEVVRDKDGLSALLLFAQMAAELAASGSTVLDKLEQLYRQHGLFLTRQHSIATRPGGASITSELRANPPTDIAGRAVVSSADLQTGRREYADGTTQTLDFHPADVVVYYLDDRSRVIVRPSGTEPKTKCYYEVVRAIADDESYAESQAAARESLENLVVGHQRSIEALGVT